jgi:hypothetical protein
MIEVGQKVKCLLRIGTLVEGIVEEWGTSLVKIKSLDGKSLMIIHSPTADIVLTKVELEPAEDLTKKPERELPVIKQQITDKLQEVMHSDDYSELDLAQLRKLVVEQEKKIITEKRREHFGSGRRGTSYSNPLGISAYVPGKLPRK